MGVIVYNHRDQFEILPAICIARTPVCWCLLISWGTVTIDIEVERKRR